MNYDAEQILKEIIEDFDHLAVHYWIEWLASSSNPRKPNPYYEDARKCALWREMEWKVECTPEFNSELLNLRAKDLKYGSPSIGVLATRQSKLAQAFKMLVNDQSLSFPDALRSSGLETDKSNETAIRAMAKTDIEKEQLKRNRKGRTPKE